MNARLPQPPRLVPVPDTWTGDEALAVANLLEALLRCVRQRYADDLHRARQRHVDLAGEPWDDFLEEDCPF
ncbi:MAG: hypothetical protein RBU45_25430 [Myxococcota bacterium]|jgi:hypothetical protein|nr:hypothetical protein [Myxococcota bacterium]